MGSSASRARRTSAALPERRPERHPERTPERQRARSSGSLCNGGAGRKVSDGDLRRSLPNRLDGGGEESASEASSPIATPQPTAAAAAAQMSIAVSQQPQPPAPPPRSTSPPLLMTSTDVMPNNVASPAYSGNLLPAQLVLPPASAAELYPFITPEATFAVAVARGPRGLGLSLAGGAGEWPGAVRVRRLFAPQPALRPGDLLLAANGVPLLGLTAHEALEVLRRAPGDVVLTACRPPAELCCLPPCEPPPPPPPPRRIPYISALSPAPHIEPQGEEFVVRLRKENGGLGFTLRRAGSPPPGGDDVPGEDMGSAGTGGHFIRALVREPALSDGRLRPGDQILEVNGMSVESLTHEEAVAFLRSCGDEVWLRLRRLPAAPPPPLACAPSSHILSASEDSPPASPPVQRALRPEAVDLLQELHERRGGMSPAGGREHRQPPAPPASPPASPSPSPSPPSPPTSPASPVSPCSISRSPWTITVAPPKGESLKEDGGCPSPSAGTSLGTRRRRPASLALESDAPPLETDTPPPISLPPMPCAPSSPLLLQGLGGSDAGVGDVTGGGGGDGLRKWKGALLSPEDAPTPFFSPALSPAPTDEPPYDDDEELVGEKLTVELSRGWNARLGFSVCARGRRTAVRAVHAGSVAARDGRLRVGDVLIEINEESVEHLTTSDIIDLLRKIRGTIAITVVRPPPKVEPPATTEAAE